VVPLLNRIVVRKLEAPLKSAGGIILKETDENGPQVGHVVSVGGGHIYDNGKRRDMLIQPGQTVLLPSYM
jgi:chaperonin GroES